MQSADQRRKNPETDFFSEYGDASRYKIQEIIGKGSYGVVSSAMDTHTGERVAIKKINDIFEHVSDATRILREIKLLRILRHPDIVEIKHIMLPPSGRDFKDIYVVFELMESDLHQVIKANDDLTPEHYQFFLYQLLRALKYIHTANVFHRDLKPKNVLANADCKLKICDFGLARVAFHDTPTAIFWTDYVATRWYRAPELCGSFFSKYTPAIDIWSIGCIFAEILSGKPLFPGKNVVHQLELITDLLGTPPPDVIARVRNEKARRYLITMQKKPTMHFSQKFPNADPLALRLLERLLAFDPKDRPSAEEALADPYFKGLAKVEREPSAQPISKLEFEFERRRVSKEDVRQLIYREILEYHPLVLKEYGKGADRPNFLYPSAIDQFRKQFSHLEGGGLMPLERQHASLPRPCLHHHDKTQEQAEVKDHVLEIRDESAKHMREAEKLQTGNLPTGYYKSSSQNSSRAMLGPPAKPGKVVGPGLPMDNGYDPQRFVRNGVSSSSTQNWLPMYSYQRRNVTGMPEKSEKRELLTVEGVIQQKTQFAGIGVGHKIAAASNGASQAY
ncbi:hypothetical protein L7F22_051387 [Adiantum nelumboides]|nr:hypothetical protein [Adiantum nelumboides]